MGRGQELLDAAREGNRRTVEKILGQITKRSGPFTSLRRGAGVNVQDDNGYTPLHHACLRGHREIVRMLLSVDASPCVVDKKGATPLHLAAWKGDSDIVAMLLAHKNPSVNIDQQTSDQETALIIASQFGYVDVVAQLMANGADVTVRNIKDETALDLAAHYGRLETVQHLLRSRPQLVDRYKSPICRGMIFSSTPLHRAAKNGHREVVSTLIAAGIDPNIRTHTGTPLHEAACFGKASVVKTLLARGADLNAADRRGKTVHDLLADYSEEATRRVRRAIREYENATRNTYESEEDLPPFPVQDHSPTYPNVAMKAPETHENPSLSLTPSPSSSSIPTKSHGQSFVQKLASKFKAKFSSAPNISETGTDSVPGKSNLSEKTSTSTSSIGNSKFFFKSRSKRDDELGDIDCTHEFDTISLDDRLGTISRDATVNRSNRSCPGFKTSLPNISENNELSDSESIVITDIDCDKRKDKETDVTEAVNVHATKIESKENNRTSVLSNVSEGATSLINECYESYDFKENKVIENNNSLPKPLPPPRPTMAIRRTNEDIIYENIVPTIAARPTPAARKHIPVKIPLDEVEKKTIYENVTVLREKMTPEPTKRAIALATVDSLEKPTSITKPSPSVSRSSSLTSSTSSDSMIDETNLEDILLSEKSKSFRHGMKLPRCSPSRSDIYRTKSNASYVSDFSDVTEASALENVDVSDDVDDKALYLSMTGTLPNKKQTSTVKKKVLFRHKTFTNIEVDRNSINHRDLPKFNADYLKETLGNYHIRGTGHCIYKGPTVQEFIEVFNRETLYKHVPPFTQVPTKRDSYFETAICFCKPRPPKHHSSAEDLLEIGLEPSQNEEDQVTIDFGDVNSRRELVSSSFRCFCDTGDCALHSNKRDLANSYIVKFSAIKKSISTPDITLDSTPPSTGLPKNKSVPSNLEEPYAVVNVEDILKRNKTIASDQSKPDSPVYTTMSHQSTISSSHSAGLYSVKDIAEVISLSDNSTLTNTSSTNPACESARVRKSTSSDLSHWSLQSCNSNITIKSDLSFKTCPEESSDDDSDGTLHTDEDPSDTETVKSEVSTGKRPWTHSDSFRFGNRDSKFESDVIEEEDELKSSKIESGISVGSEFSSDEEEMVPRESIGTASLERDRVVRSGSGRRRWDEAEGTSEGDALSVSSAASSCAPMHLAHHHEYSKVSPTPPKKPPRRNLSVSPTHANSPSSGYSYEHMRVHARSQDDLDDIQGAKHYLKHGRSVDQYVDGKLSYAELEDNHNSPRFPVPNPRPSLIKNRSQPVAITARYENVFIKEQNPKRKLRRNNFDTQYESCEPRMENRVRKYSNQDKSSLESLLDDTSMNSPSDGERYYDNRVQIPLSPSHYEQPPTPEHPPPSAKQAENSIHERIRPLSQLIMEVVEEIRIRKKSQADVSDNS